MSVRAKFEFTGFDSSLHTRYPHKNEAGQTDHSRPEKVEMRSLKFSPVYGNGDPEHENTRFWNASPSGQIVLGCVNPEAWAQFEIGRQYYVDFTPAEG